MSQQLLQSSAQELQQKLKAGDLTSERLVELHLDQIEKHNLGGMQLKAVISVAPRQLVLQRARELDLERSKGRLRSQLHGIPIILKDCIVTDATLGMPTTAGSILFSTMQATKSATVVDQLVQNGLIVIGKANMTEFCGHKSMEPPGWSAYLGQTLSAYRLPELEDNKQPISGGSSSGSAVSIAAGFSPLGISSETAGSTVWPASLSGLYGMKTRQSTVSTGGFLKLSEHYDGLGVMARTARDLVLLTQTISGPGQQLHIPFDDSTSEFQGSWADIAVGIAQSNWGAATKEKWTAPYVKQTYDRVAETLRAEGAKVVFPIDLADADILKSDHETLVTIAYHEFPSQLAEFISYFDGACGIKTLADVIDWNEKHAEKALPEPHHSQTELIKSRDNKMTSEIHSKSVQHLHRLAVETVGGVLDEHGLDVIVSNSDATIVGYAACAGWPIATVPLGNLEDNGQPFGLFVLGRTEEVLLKFMLLFERTFPTIAKPIGPFHD